MGPVGDVKPSTAKENHWVRRDGKKATDGRRQ
jgi:hypothetical protein